MVLGRGELGDDLEARLGAEVDAAREVAVVTRQLRLITEEPDEIVVAIRRDRRGELTEGVGDLDVVAEPRQEAGPDLFS